ncbi:MAG: hypothetical protein ABL889_00790 [Terricaulis sp.]
MTNNDRSAWFVIGVTAYALSLAALGAIELWRGASLPGLHALPESAPEWAVRCMGALMLATSVTLIAGPFVRWASIAAAAFWSAFFILALIAAAAAQGDASGWVSASETAVFAAIALARGGGPRTASLLRTAFGLMLILFGAVHLTHRDLIASLIPDWIPFSAYWPWLTGGANILAGLACVIGRGTRPATYAIAIMFGAWLALVHAPRLAAHPASLFEWTFALTAAALLGGALQIASRASGSRPLA